MAMGDSASEPAEKKRFRGAGRGCLPASPALWGAGVSRLPKQAGAWGRGWGGCLWGNVEGLCVGRQVRVCAHLCTHVNIQLPFYRGF